MISVLISCLTPIMIGAGLIGGLIHWVGQIRMHRAMARHVERVLA